MISNSFWIWFNVFILAMLALDLVVLNKRPQEITIKESLKWVGFWVALAVIFNIIIYYWLGKLKAIEFLTGYVIEWSLSVDNLFVFILIFTYFKVPKEYQHRVLFWGIIGALILRGTFILVGIALFNMFSWMIFIFGGILIFTGIKMLFQKEEDDPKLDDNLLVRFFKKVFPVTETYAGKNFFIKQNNVWHATPLFLVLLVVDFTDLVFAVDSIPAVLSVTTDTFIVYTSNVFAILGLRSLYFALAGMMGMFHYLKYGLAIILSFVGGKMLLSHYYEIPTLLTLGLIVSVLLLSVFFSILKTRRSANEYEKY